LPPESSVTCEVRERSDKPYPLEWERSAEIRVLRARVNDWQKLLSWRADMGKRGWRLLDVHSEGDQLTAIFGRPREGGQGGRERPPPQESPLTRTEDEDGGGTNGSERGPAKAGDDPS
jgi:hypothetical protein